MTGHYNYKNCQSLFGYAFAVHIRSSGTCQLCQCGGPSLNFDLWRQMTVEHLIGKKQGGYLKEIRVSIAECFPDLQAHDREELATAIDATNTVTACSFCNSTTSQTSSSVSMPELIRMSVGRPDETLGRINTVLKVILEQKRADVHWKLASVRREYEARFVATLPHLPPTSE